VSNSKRKRRGPLPPFIGPIAPEPLPEWVISTDPGCHPSDPFFELHSLEVQGAMMALHIRGPWFDQTLMDCGCVLELLPVSALSDL
jgi:hypothetical protein